MADFRPPDRLAPPAPDSIFLVYYCNVRFSPLCLLFGVTTGTTQAVRCLSSPDSSPWRAGRAGRLQQDVGPSLTLSRQWCSSGVPLDAKFYDVLWTHVCFQKVVLRELASRLMSLSYLSLIACKMCWHRSHSCLSPVL